MEETVNQPTTNDAETRRKQRAAGGAFLVGVAGVAAGVGFGRTLSTVRKQDPTFFQKGMTGSIEMADTGANLALRALGWGTLLAIFGTGSLCFAVWKFSGAKDLQDFRMKCGSILPKLTPDKQTSRTEFEGLTDLMTYISTWKKSP